jgi:hypothetical protein
MVLNRDYSAFPSTPLASLESTAAHEYNHSLQFGYGALSGANAPDDVFVEGGASWMEDEVFDAADDNYNFLWPAFADGLGEYDASPYAYWIAFRGLTERYGTGTAGGGEQVMQDFWERTSQNAGDNLTALQAALGNRGTNLADAFHAYAIAVKFRRPCGSGYAYPYCLEEGPGYPSTSALSPHHTISAAGGATPSTGNGRARLEDNYSLNWVALPASGPYDVTLQNLDSGGGQLRATLACDTGAGISLSPLPDVVGPNGSTTLAGYAPPACVGGPVAVVTNQAQTAANPATSTTRNYRLSTAAPAGPPADPLLTVTRDGSGSGTVASAPAGIQCGGDCSESYPPGTPVTLTAMPSGSSTFTGWSGAGCSGTGTCAVTLSAATNVVATFSLPKHALTVSRQGSGTVTSSPAGIGCGSACSAAYDEGTAVTLTAVGAEGWSFAGWTGDCAGTGACEVTMSAARDVGATFVENATGGGGTGGGGTPPPAGGTTPAATNPITGPLTTIALDVRPPRLSSLRATPGRFRARRGTTVRYTLSEPARVIFRIERSLGGRRVGGSCMPTTARNRSRPRCTRWKRLAGELAQSGRRGPNARRFGGSLAGRRLAAGRYRFAARPTDAAGNRGLVRRAAFTVVV